MSNMQKTWKRILVKTNCMQAHSFESVRMRKSSTKSLTVNQAKGRLSTEAKSPIMEQYNIEPLNT